MGEALVYCMVMVNWYQRVIVPRLLNAEMGLKELENIRRDALADVSGVVLEIGVGPGYNIPLYTHISKLYALDPSKELIDIAKTRSGAVSFPVEFLNASAEHIPLSEKSVDTVVSTWTLCSVGDPRAVLREIKRILKPGGRFVFVEHGVSPHKGVRVVQMLYTLLTKHFTGNCHYDRPITELFKDAGFEFEKIVAFPEPSKLLIYNYKGIAR